MVRLLTRYTLRQFVTTVGFSLLALTVLFVLVDLFNQLDKFLDHKAPAGVIVRYYFWYIPQIIELIAPIAIMLGALFSIGRLSNLNEITAMRAGGLGNTRFLMPIVMFGAAVSLLQVYFNGWVVPQANRSKIEIERRYLGSDVGRNVVNDLFFRESPTMNIAIGRYDIDLRQGNDVTIEQFTSVGSPRITTRWDVAAIEWDSARSSWIGKGIVRRRFTGDTVELTAIALMPVPFTTQHHEIMRLQQSIDEMTFTELAAHVETLRKGGRQTRVTEIDLAGQWAFPFVDMIVILLTVPFATVRRRGGVAVNISAAMVVSISYIAFSKIGQAIGATTSLPIWLVGWSSNVIFGLLGILVVFRFRK